MLPLTKDYKFPLYQREYAMELLDKGKSQTDVAKCTGATQGTISLWRKAYIKTGKDGLVRKTASGRPKKLNDNDIYKLIAVLNKGAKAYGYETNVWTLKRIKHIIKSTVGIDYHIGHIWKVLIKHKLILKLKTPSIPSNVRELLLALNHLRKEKKENCSKGYQEKEENIKNVKNEKKFKFFVNERIRRQDSSWVMAYRELFHDWKKITKKDIQKKLGWSDVEFNSAFRKAKKLGLIIKSSTRGWMYQARMRKPIQVRISTTHELRQL